MADRRYHMAVDTGGTLTDLVASDRRTGAVRSVKGPSTPADPAPYPSTTGLNSPAVTGSPARPSSKKRRASPWCSGDSRSPSIPTACSSSRSDAMTITSDPVTTDVNDVSVVAPVFHERRLI